MGAINCRMNPEESQCRFDFMKILGKNSGGLLPCSTSRTDLIWATSVRRLFGAASRQSVGGRLRLCSVPHFLNGVRGPACPIVASCFRLDSARSSCCPLRLDRIGKSLRDMGLFLRLAWAMPWWAGDPSILALSTPTRGPPGCARRRAAAPLAGHQRLAVARRCGRAAAKPLPPRKPRHGQLCDLLFQPCFLFPTRSWKGLDPTPSPRASRRLAAKPPQLFFQSSSFCILCLSKNPANFPFPLGIIQHRIIKNAPHA